MNSLLLSIDQLTVGLPGGAERSHAVEAVSLTLDRGETLCIVGESGSGKSVLALAVMGLLPSNLPIRGGSIRFHDEELTALSGNQYRKLRGNRIGMIFQEPGSALNPVLTVGAQMDGVLAAHQSVSSTKRRRRRLELLELMKLSQPASIASRYPHELSGGQRQRVMIAMALANNPSLLIADEPTTALDVTSQNEILRLLAQLRRQLDLAILFITHDFGIVADIADRVAVMSQGKVVETGPAQHILHRPAAPYTRRLIAAVPMFAPQAPEATEASVSLLQVQALSKTFRAGRGLFDERHAGVKALDGIDLMVGRGEVVAVVGESGSGKSTLAQIVAGLLKPDAGAVRLDGVELTALSGRQRRRMPAKVQMVFQDPFSSLNPRHRVERIITEAPIVHGADRSEVRAEMVRLLELVGLDPSVSRRYPHAFSGGQRQRIGLARALIMKPQLLIADEPVSALDVSVQKQVLELLGAIRRELGLTMLFITHDLRVASSVGDRIVVMHRGRIVEEGTSGSVLHAPKSDYTKSLVAAIPGLSWERSRAINSSAEAPC